jgi:hypothetical protein
MAIGLAQIVARARTELHDLTGLEVASTLDAARDGDEWVVGLEVVEKRSIPDSMDILATYRTRLDLEGNMLEFKRIKIRKRIDTTGEREEDF